MWFGVLPCTAYALSNFVKVRSLLGLWLLYRSLPREEGAGGRGKGGVVFVVFPFVSFFFLFCVVESFCFVLFERFVLLGFGLSIVVGCWSFLFCLLTFLCSRRMNCFKYRLKA